MIELRKDINPKQTTLDKLAEFQSEIDSMATFTERSKQADVMFRNRKNNKAFDDVKNCLTKMCNSTRRCVCCEDSLADEIEHIYPKNLFPGKCFRWDNYVYACGPCNGPKNNKFAIFRADNGQFQEINPPTGTPATEPLQGEAAIINPRVENPLDYCILDLKTFKFIVLGRISAKDKKKADYTFNTVLRLNDTEREPVRQARENAFEDYRKRLFYYVSKKMKNDTPKSQLQKMIEEIKKADHPTVWKEVQRYHQTGKLEKIDKEFDDFFKSAPEALNC